MHPELPAETESSRGLFPGRVHKLLMGHSLISVSEVHIDQITTLLILATM